MSTHPNVILKCTVKPEGTTRKLLRDLLAQNREEIPDTNLPFMLDSKGQTIINRNGYPVRISRDGLTIGSHSYHTLVMESDYDEGWQISGEEGDLIIFGLVTYGYGEEISWEDLAKRVGDIQSWALQPQRNLTVKISVTANYW